MNYFIQTFTVLVIIWSYFIYQVTYLLRTQCLWTRPLWQSELVADSWGYSWLEPLQLLFWTDPARNKRIQVDSPSAMPPHLPFGSLPLENSWRHDSHKSPHLCMSIFASRTICSLYLGTWQLSLRTNQLLWFHWQCISLFEVWVLSKLGEPCKRRTKFTIKE